MDSKKRSIPLAVPNIGDAEIEAVNAAVRSGWVSTAGPSVTEIEKLGAQICGTEDAVAVAAGTMAIHVALVAVGVARNDVVIAPSYTFIATANAISHAGADPVFVDVDPANLTMCPRALRAWLAAHAVRRADGSLALAETGQRIGAILPVYANGHPADIDAIMAIGKEFGLPVVADAAAAIGGASRGRPLGPLADLTAFSFNGNKTVTSGGGGMVAGPNPALVKKVRHLVTTARLGTDYDHDVIGFNYRITNLEAALGAAQLRRLDEFLDRKRAIHAAYSNAFAGRNDVSGFPQTDPGSACWFSGIVLSEGAHISVPELIAALNERGIGVRSFWIPMHLVQAYKSLPHRQFDGALPVTENIYRRILPLPNSTNLTDDDLGYVIETVGELLDKARPA
mgnify:CR=1 FL=1